MGRQVLPLSTAVPLDAGELSFCGLRATRLCGSSCGLGISGVLRTLLGVLWVTAVFVIMLKCYLCFHSHSL